MTNSMNQKNTMLRIGEIKILKEDEEIVWTILGSCISVIFHTNMGLSLICHAQMPTRDITYDNICADSCPHPCFNYLPDSMKFKYVSCSIEYMLEVMKQNGVNLRSVNTSLLGGASTLGRIELKKTIGERNVQIAKKILSENKIVINRELTGGSHALTLWYSPKNNRLHYRNNKNQLKLELK